MNLLYFVQWPLSEGLTQATVFPNLALLLDHPKVSKLVFCSIETEAEPSPLPPAHAKLMYEPLVFKRSKWRLIAKWLEYSQIPLRLADLCKKHGIQCAMARGATAGSLLYRMHKRTQLRYVVESFEPHADYMREAGHWKRYSLSYVLQSYWERRQCQTAHTLITVSHAYRSLLCQTVPRAAHSIAVAPCSVSKRLFQFNPQARHRIRTELGLSPKTPVGIYVGKLGGIYFSPKQAALIFATAQRIFPNLRLILLTPMPIEPLKKALKEHLSTDSITFIGAVAHTQVPNYLSAADFAFSLHLPTPAKRFVSPIKNAEYWTNGLPILAPKGVGDDSKWIQQNPIGVLLNSEQLQNTTPFEQLKKLVRDRQKAPHVPNAMTRFVAQYRSAEYTKIAYQALLAQLSSAYASPKPSLSVTEAVC